MNRDLKQKIFDLLKEKQFSFIRKWDDSKGYIPFIEMLWDIDNLPSTDNRFSTLREDIVQHTINNDDWDVDYLFIDRLELFKTTNKFNEFIELVMSVEFRSSQREMEEYYQLVNPLLEEGGLMLEIESHMLLHKFEHFSDEYVPLYKLYDLELLSGLPPEVGINKIPFFVQTSDYRGTPPNLIINLNDPIAPPYFVLVFNNGWNDYSHKTIFQLYYFEESSSFISFGQVKILNTFESLSTHDDIPKKFGNLGRSFCSLGQSYEFYEQLKEKFGNQFLSVLFALRDSAFFPSIQEAFEADEGFQSSLLRNEGAERVLRLIKHRIDGEDISDIYRFKYLFVPKYSTNKLEVSFDFRSGSKPFERIYSIIGENGSGKTQLMSTLPIDLSEKNQDAFESRIPFFSKIIAVSYSSFDEFEIPKNNAYFNYHHCGLRKSNGEKYTDGGLLKRFNTSWGKIEHLERINKWREILLRFIEPSIVDMFLLDKKDIELKRYPKQMNFLNSFVVDNEGFIQARKILSSGQSIILYILTEVIAHIRLDSLILYDEPETHLHPNAITRLLNAIYDLTHEFDSYCILATHSPLVVRELLSNRVYILERNENTPSIRKIGIECFGENLSVIADEVFGNKSAEKQYKSIISRMVDRGLDFDDILAEIQSDVPMSLSATMYIQNLLSQNDQS